MRTILVVREHDIFSRMLAANGFEIINLPLIETKVLSDLSKFEEKLSVIENYDGIFVTSRQAAQILVNKLHTKQIIFGGKVYVLGKRGFDVLRDENLDLVFDETANTAQEMLENIAPADLKNKRFLFVRGTKSLRIVPEFLAKIAAVDETIVYETREITMTIDELKKVRDKFTHDEIAAACFFSPSAAEVFLEQFGTEITHQTLIAAIGKTTAEYFERRGVKVNFVSSKSRVEIFAENLTEYLNKYESDAQHFSGKT